MAAARNADCLTVKLAEGGGGGGSARAAAADAARAENDDSSSGGGDDDEDNEFDFACTQEGCAAAYMDGQVALLAAAVKEIARLLSEVEIS